MRDVVGRLVVILLLAMVLGAMYFAATFVMRGESSAAVLSTLPGPVRAAVPQGNGLLVAAGQGGVVHVDTSNGAITPVLDVTGQRFADIILFNDKAYVLAEADDGKPILHVIDPVARRLIRNQALTSAVTDLAGCLKDGTLVVIEGTSVRFLKPDGRTSLVPVSGGVLNAGWLGDGRLYVARSYAGGLAIIDTNDPPRLLEVIEVKDWLTSVSISGGNAYVMGSQNGFGLIDLQTKEYRPLKVTDVMVTPAGTTYAIDADSICRLDERGRERDKVALPKWLLAKGGGGRLLIAQADAEHAILARGNQLIKVSTRPHDTRAVAQAPEGR